MTRVLVWLRSNADIVLVAAGAAYSALLRQLCAAHGGRSFNPFTGLRDGGDGITAQNQPDGIYLRDYVTLAGELRRRIEAD